MVEVFETARKRLREIRDSIIDEPEKKRPDVVRRGMDAIMSVKEAHRDVMLESDGGQRDLHETLCAFSDAKVALANEEFHYLWLQQVIRQVESEDLDEFKKASEGWETVGEFPAVLRQLKVELEERAKMESLLREKVFECSKEARSLEAQKKIPRDAAKTILDLNHILRNLAVMYAPPKDPQDNAKTSTEPSGK